MPSVSIIVPIYNSEKYIDTCINSILVQTFTDFELILVDDGSPDNCGQICDDYALKDKRIIVIHKENGGVASARNAGLDVAKGKYISFVDSDDWINENFLLDATTLCEKLMLDIYMCGFIKPNENDPSLLQISKTIDFQYNELNEDICTKLLEYNYISSVWGKIIRYSFIGQLRFHDKMQFGEDLTFIFELLNKSPRCYVTTNTYYNYRDTTNSLTKQYSKEKLIDVIKTYNVLLDFSDFHNYQTVFLKYIKRRWIEDLLYLQNMIINSHLTLIKKIHLLSVLISDDRLRNIILHSDNKYCRRYSPHPVLQICYSKYLTLKRKGNKNL